MPSKNIYLPEDLYFKLKDEENTSQLITELLYNYFENKSINVDDLDRREEEIKKKREEMNKEIEEEENKLITKKEIKQKQIEQIKEKEKLTKEKEEEQEQHIRDNFKHFTNRDITEEELKEYKEKFEMGYSLFDYIREKGFKLGGIID